MMDQERNWTYQNFTIKEGLKPGAANFQYFFVVSQGGRKKCNYCVWMGDEVLDCHTNGKCYAEIAASKREEWCKWVQSKIDNMDFRNLVLKIDKAGQQEINLNEMKEKLNFE